ncbi:zinc-ribbon domain-containing protein, partial [Methylobrevis pamukkalensis]|uniref:zinc-ribbon domain-containing protein n=1 Tax=Methylobrevis pamukkalensis TaxID=1439726 RepID=UPI001AEC7C6C
MKITCPNCDTSYQLADGAVGPAGRNVRCKRCETVWHAMPDASAFQAAEGNPFAGEDFSAAGFGPEFGPESGRDFDRASAAGPAQPEDPFAADPFASGGGEASDGAASARADLDTPLGGPGPVVDAVPPGFET